MNIDNLDLVRAIDEQRRAGHRPPSQPMERRRRRHAMAKALHGLATRIEG
ncbi:MAG TPA: hypothetical protein VFJ14_02235 [Nocardioidaceae bacterium]|nr:hypothetical protein [Nocardioidaceae bacterium]